jgi:hypothetical protein
MNKSTIARQLTPKHAGRLLASAIKKQLSCGVAVTVAGGAQIAFDQQRQAYYVTGTSVQVGKALQFLQSIDLQAIEKVTP